MNRDREDRNRDYDRDDDDRDYKQRRPPRAEIRYKFVVNGKPAPDEIHGTNFRIGNTVSTSRGPYLVVEVFWFSDIKAQVLLRPVVEKPAQKPVEEPKPTQKPPRSRTNLPAQKKKYTKAYGVDK